jgi:hypothetical protein
MTETERKAGLRRGGQHAHYLRLIKWGRPQEAEVYRQKVGLPAVVAAQEVRSVTATVTESYFTDPEITHRNGWPVEAEVTVKRFCRNPRLIAVELPDGREASMWKARKGYEIHAKVKAKLVDWGADPIYEDDEV